MFKSQLSEAEMHAVLDRAQATANSLTDAIDDALHDPNWDRARRRFLDAVDLFQELSAQLLEYPYLSGDLSECEREIRLLAEAFEKGNRLIPMLELGTQAWIEGLKRYSKRHDHLGKAAHHSENSRNAQSEGNFDVAWAENEKARNEYMLHANYQNWTRKNNNEFSGDL